MHHYPLITELIFILAASVVVSAAFHRLRLPAILGYLTVGVVLGPAIGLVTSVSQFNVIAELGVAFLLFTLGLEFSLPRLMALRRVVFGMGSLQVLVSVGLFLGLIYLTRDIYGIAFTGALVAASAIALSSTAIVTRELSSRGETATVHGNLAIGILLFQDIAAIVMLVLISVGGDVTHPDFFKVLTAAGFKAVIFFVAVILVGKWLLPPLFFEVGKTKSEELFMLCVLVVALASAAIAESLGLSMALGAFMAGMMLGESHYRYQIETEIRPFRDVLLGVFFVSVGLKIDLELITSFWPRILFFAACLILFKTVLITVLCRLFGYTNSDALRTGLILSQGGEFGFALLALAAGDALLPDDVASFFLSIIVLSMAITPWLIHRSRPIAETLLMKLDEPVVNEPEEYQPPEFSQQQSVILCGFGRVGQTIARFLKLEDIHYVALDDDPERVQKGRTLGENLVYGDAGKFKLLQALGLERASLLVISFDNPDVAIGMVKRIRAAGMKLPILVRTNDDANLAALQQAGATEVIPETLEASLMLVSHVMATLGLPANKVFETIRQVRKERYGLLHGFILGARGYNEYSGELHPVFLPHDAFAVGKRLEELKIESFSVHIHTVRRGSEIKSNPGDALLLEANDIVVLGGEPFAIEQAEAYLLGGR